MEQRPVEILLVEDSPGDVWLTRETLLQGSVPKNISVVSNGEEALNFLSLRGKYANAPRPDLILLDLNLPRRDGLDVLREIKSDPDLRSITVIVLTTSEAVSDVNTAYDLNANCYIIKPVELDKFTVAIRGIEDFWMRLAWLPTGAPPPDHQSELADSDGSAGSLPETDKPAGDFGKLFTRVAHHTRTGAVPPVGLPHSRPQMRHTGNRFAHHSSSRFRD